MDIKEFIRSASRQQLEEVKDLIHQALMSFPKESRTRSQQKGYSFVTDGASRGNPGLAGAGLLIFNPQDQLVFEDCRFLGTVTNNEAEYRALLLALEQGVRFTTGAVTCVMDSELVVKQMKGQYTIKSEKLKQLSDLVKEKSRSFSSVNFVHVPREHPWLRLADKLANKGIDLRKGDNYGR